MIAALLAAACAALEFSSQDIAPLRVTASRALTGDPVINAVQADLDGDGLLDLLFSDRVALQRDGGYPPDAMRPLPAAPPGAEADVWGVHLYLRHANGLEVHRLRGEGWDLIASHAVAWPAAGALEPAPWRRAESAESRVELRRFLHDTDGNGVPEVVLVDESGVWIHRLVEGAYTAEPPRAVLPALALAPAPPQPVWPADARRIAVPTRQMACRLNLRGADLVRLTQDNAPDGRIAYHRDVYPGALSAGAAAASPRRESTAPLPPHLRPLRLGGRDFGVFAGVRWEMAPAPLPTPLLEVWITTDAGRSLRRERMRLPQGYQPAAVFADVDGDGFPDLLVEESGLFDGGMREAALRFQTQATVRHRLRVYPGQAGGGFGGTPILAHEAGIRLDAPPGRHSRLFHAYQGGGLVNLTGDFDGDGKLDLAVRDQPGRVAIHLQRDGRFAGTPDAVIPLEYDTPFHVADVNGDGRADVVVLWADSAAPRAEPVTRAHFSRGARR